MQKLKILSAALFLTLFIKTSAQAYNPYLGQIMWVPYDFAPYGWAQCNGQLLSIAQNSNLFSLLGTQFGGNGTTTFALPDMQGRTIIGASQKYPIGNKNGESSVTLKPSELPTHTHTVNAVKIEGNDHLPTNNFYADTKVQDPEYSDAPTNTTMSQNMIGVTGSDIPHNNMQPYAALKCIISLHGNFPPKN